MDKSWMNIPHRPEYIEGIKQFIACASNHLDKKGRTRCPCNQCNNSVYKLLDEVNDHLFDYGMNKDYTHWVHHGEPLVVLTDDDEDDDDNDSCVGEGGRFDGLDDLFEDIRASTHIDNPMPNVEHEDLREGYTVHTTDGESSMGVLNMSEGNIKAFDKLLSKARQPLYPGCKKFSTLDYLAKLFHLKIINCWSNKSFDMVLKLIKAGLPAGETLPNSYYEAKTLMRNLGLGYISIQVRNQNNRGYQTVPHLAGSKSFVRHRYEQRDLTTNKEPSVVEFYRTMHYHPVKGWTAPVALENYDSMVDILSQPPVEDSLPPTDVEAFNQVMGMRSGYVRGLGHGEVAPSRRAGGGCNHPEVEVLRRRAEEAESQLEEFRVHQAAQDERSDAQQARIDALQAQMEMILAQMPNIGSGPTNT